MPKTYPGSALPQSSQYNLAVPILGVGIGVLSVAVTIMALSRTGSLGRRFVYQDGQYLVSVRRGQMYDLRDFVQPDNPDVVALYSEIGPDAWALYDWVARNISYRLDIGEMFFFPSETLARGAGDCEDTAILITSLVRAGGDDCHVALGTLRGLGHAWVVHRGEILETTFTSARPTPDPEAYELMVMFNDTEVIELWPGALGELFGLARDEATKLNLMARAVDP